MYNAVQQATKHYNLKQFSCYLPFRVFLCFSSRPQRRIYINELIVRNENRPSLSYYKQRHIVRDITINLSGNPTKKCTSSQFMCENEECIQVSKKCDGVFDCEDKSDEAGCATKQLQNVTCSSAQWACKNGICIPRNDRCNKIMNCEDGSDEMDCPTGDYSH